MASARELHAALETLLRVHTRPDASASASGAASVATRASDSSSDGDNDDAATPQQQPQQQQLQQPQQQQLQVVRAKKRPRQARKPTYYVRKEETKALQTELAVLSAQLAYLTSESGILASPHPVAPSLLAQLQDALQRKQAENVVLRDAVRGNALTLARIQSAFSGRATAAHTRLPFESVIRLGTDWRERHATLLALKDAKLRGAQEYMAERTRWLDPSTPHMEHARFVNSDGDLCGLRLDIVPFDGVSSVQRVFDALLFYLFNMEISVTEVLGDVTVRENEGRRVQGISQNRLVSSLSNDLQVETNSALFCELYHDSSATTTTSHGASSRDVGVVVANFVSDDALYPYAPAARLRNDITAAITISLEPKTSAATRRSGSQQCHTEDAAGDNEGDLIVVMRRTGYICLRHTDLPIPPHMLEELRRRIEGWGDAMLETVRSIVYPQPTTAATAVAAMRW